MKKMFFMLILFIVFGFVIYKSKKPTLTNVEVKTEFKKEVYPDKSKSIQKYNIESFKDFSLEDIELAKKELIEEEIGQCYVEDQDLCLDILKKNNSQNEQFEEDFKQFNKINIIENKAEVFKESVHFNGPNYLTTEKWAHILDSLDKTWKLSASSLNVKLKEELVENNDQKMVCYSVKKNCEQGTFSSIKEEDLLLVMDLTEYIDYLIRREKLENYIKNPRNGLNKYDKDWYEQKRERLRTEYF